MSIITRTLQDTVVSKKKQSVLYKVKVEKLHEIGFVWHKGSV